jgi:hypothetical protein
LQGREVPESSSLGKLSETTKGRLRGAAQKEASETAFLAQLLLDNKLFEETPGVTRKLHQPKKR